MEVGLVEQLRMQRPALVLSLGLHVPPALGSQSPELGQWATGKGLRHLDAVGPVCSGVTFRGLDSYRTTVVALLHPYLFTTPHALVLAHRRDPATTLCQERTCSRRRGMV